MSYEISYNDTEKEAKSIKTEQRKKNMEQKQKNDAREAEKLAQERKKQKEDRKFTKVGKPAMARSQKEKLDRKKEEVKILTEEERNRLRYLEIAW